MPSMSIKPSYIKSLLHEHYKSKWNAVILVAIIYIFVMILLVYVVMLTSVLVVVQGSSMENTLFDRQLVLLSRWGSNFGINRTVVFADPSDSIDDNGNVINIIKRVVAVEGDVVQFVSNEDGTVSFFRGSYDTLYEVDEYYIREPMSRSFFNTTSLEMGERILIERGYVFVMGDNRNNSMDSRHFGSVPLSSIIGAMYVRIAARSVPDAILRWVYGL